MLLCVVEVEGQMAKAEEVCCVVLSYMVMCFPSLYRDVLYDVFLCSVPLLYYCSR